jgi:hypothetical protein
MIGETPMESTHDCNCLNCCLKARWEQYYELSEKRILTHPETYQQIKASLTVVCDQVIDIEVYFETARRISCLLETMGPGTVFYNYFHEQIDPRQSGDVRYFRSLCRDLREQIHALDRWRKKQRKIRLVE